LCWNIITWILGITKGENLYIHHQPKKHIIKKTFTNGATARCLGELKLSLLGWCVSLQDGLRAPNQNNAPKNMLLLGAAISWVNYGALKSIGCRYIHLCNLITKYPKSPLKEFYFSNHHCFYPFVKVLYISKCASLNLATKNMVKQKSTLFQKQFAVFCFPLKQVRGPFVRRKSSLQSRTLKKTEIVHVPWDWLQIPHQNMKILALLFVIWSTWLIGLLLLMATRNLARKPPDLYETLYILGYVPY